MDGLKSTTFALLFLSLACTKAKPPPIKEVWLKPGDSIQSEIDRAAQLDPKPTVRFRPGTYLPARKGQAVIALNEKHNGLQLLGEEGAVLTAADPDSADPKAHSYPAIVNHVVYLGNGLTNATKIAGFKITGAKGFLTRMGEFNAEPNRNYPRRFIYYADGGGIKVYGKSSPILENLVIEKNWGLYCGAGISVEQMGLTTDPVVIRNVRFEDNIVPLTGAALDLLPGSHARVENSVFKNNKANSQWLPADKILKIRKDFSPRLMGGEDLSLFKDSSAVTVFDGSSLQISDSKFEGNSGDIDFNAHVKWYWPVARSAFSRLPSRIQNVEFSGGTAHSVKVDPRWTAEIQRDAAKRPPVSR